MKLTPEETVALVEWANESYRTGGCTAYGPKFTAAMIVARNVRERSHALLQCEESKNL